MNNTLKLKGQFNSEGNKAKGGGISIPTNSIITVNHINTLINQLATINNNWDNDNNINGLIIHIHYKELIAKSNRIQVLFNNTPNKNVVGAKYNGDKNKHIITYYISNEELNKTIKNLTTLKKIFNTYFNGSINSTMFKDSKLFEDIEEMKPTVIKKHIKDVLYIESFNVLINEFNLETNSVVNFYNINKFKDESIDEVLKSININLSDINHFDDNTYFLNEAQKKIIAEKIPSLVSMAVIDITELNLEPNNGEVNKSIKTIKDPKNEPTIGVIDTLFDERVYFNKWVEYKQVISEDIPTKQNDYRHGTAVSSLIVDGPAINPWLEDNCGNFRVRHFGVAVAKGFSSYDIMLNIKTIVQDNLDIKVWNLSIGANRAINDNSISFEGSILDDLQTQYDIIFIIAGTNKNEHGALKIGPPADSINSIVVNAVDYYGDVPDYGREGFALTYFKKPDVSYYGGCSYKKMKVCEPHGEANLAGTSFAAPFIARKMAYLIQIMGFKRQEAKALLIDSAIGWEQNGTKALKTKGYGIVPIDINDIVKTKKDEFKFVIFNTAREYNTYNHKIPIPLMKDKYAYTNVRATLCYFPKCSRSQGVDYTNQELNITFGRIKDKIKSINENFQDDDKYYTNEKKAREEFGKWENVKVLNLTTKKEMKSYDSKKWGIQITKKNRLSDTNSTDIDFGLVISFKAMDNRNMIEDFIKNCSLAGWIIKEVAIEQQVILYEKLNEDIVLE